VRAGPTTDHTGSINSKFLQGHLNFLHSHEVGLKVDGRVLANLTWALAKLDLSADDSALTTEIALTAAPFIVRTIDTSSPQVCVCVCVFWVCSAAAQSQGSGAVFAKHAC
jgi:hypothetical protein